MTVHRPHPITGPWPYELSGPRWPDPPTGDRLIERRPTDDALIYDDPEEAVLYDGCERCEEHAAHPLASLDEHNLAALWAEMVRVEKRDPWTAGYRTRAEATACRELYRLAVAIERTHPRIDPWAWPWVDRLTATPLVPAERPA